jgi:hypothetical protein
MPLEWDETEWVIKVIWFFGKPEYFCKRGWTRIFQNDPTGKSLVHRRPTLKPATDGAAFF